MIPGLRVGIGYDVHRLVQERRLVLGGVEIPYTLGLEGHSDADVLLHAIMDAILGAAALGDIGQQFPPGDPAYKDASSLGLLVQVADLVKQQGWQVSNLDATLVAQAPRLAPFLEAMRCSIGQALEMDTDRVSVKATNPEGLGSLGRGEGISSYAVALLAPLGK
ncbi:MAG: 2-C-methyl-D-erythritol 2,4-cyclodiphosphate synthase [Dehalococcoidia bacterium]|nr:2-C-methyl-D-erythritol 2,4-cyclodiphosphate synthase [Dehalococcoidia bacterium]